MTAMQSLLGETVDEVRTGKNVHLSIEGDDVCIDTSTTKSTLEGVTIILDGIEIEFPEDKDTLTVEDADSYTQKYTELLEKIRNMLSSQQQSTNNTTSVEGDLDKALDMVSEVSKPIYKSIMQFCVKAGLALMGKQSVPDSLMGRLMVNEIILRLKRETDSLVSSIEGNENNSELVSLMNQCSNLLQRLSESQVNEIKSDKRQMLDK